MKTIVSMQDLRELEIKPSDLLSEYRRLFEGEVRELWKSKVSVRLDRCPACGAAKPAEVFEKWGVPYARCAGCDSIFAAVRPDEEGLTRFYNASPAVKFWREKVLHATEAARLEKLLVPRCEWILDGLSEYFPGASAGLDHTPFGGQLLKLLADQIPSLESFISSHPLSGAAAGAKIIPSPGALNAKPPPQVDFITTFEALDRAADPRRFVAAIHACLNPGGVAFLTATSASGLEIQLLGPRSPSVLPPDRLNLFSIEGLEALFAEPEWEICEISTPGMLDTEIIQRHLKAGESAFFDYIVRARGPECLGALQEFLQAHRLSSFARLIVRKKA